MSGRIRCMVTYYSVDRQQPGGELISSTREEHVGFHVENDWLYLHNSEASAPVEDLLRNACEEDRGWLAQAGTAPVYVAPCPYAPRPCGPGCGCGPGDDVGGWGGRNYPTIHVGAADLIATLDTRR